MFPHPTLARNLPDLWTLAWNVASDLENDAIPEGDRFARLDVLTTPDWIAAIAQHIPSWNLLATQQEGFTARHIITVLACCLTLPEYTGADEVTRHAIEWAALLHDIAKDLTRGRDASHPFRSAGMAATLMPGLGFQLQSGANTNSVQTWADLLLNTQTIINGQYANDHSHLPEIIDGIRRDWGEGTFASRILKGVMFHQSLPTVADWPNPILLTDEELRYSLTQQDMDVLAPIILGDSAAWTIFSDNWQPYHRELQTNIATTRRRITAQ